MDEALALPTEKAARIALRTQQVIAYETNVANVADPLGGSWFVEALTDEIERRPRRSSPTSTSSGEGSMLEGVYAGIEDGWFQGEIADSAYEFERKFNSGDRVVVGVNRFTEGNDDDEHRHPADHRTSTSSADQAAASGARPIATATPSPPRSTRRGPRPPIPSAT